MIVKPVEPVTFPDIADIAIQYIAQGLSVMPVKTDGSKEPALSKWKHLQLAAMTIDEARTNFAGDVGVGIIGGAVSGNLLIFDFDGPKHEAVERFQKWIAMVEKSPAAHLVPKFVVSDTPKGVHVFVRCVTPVKGSKKLAMRPVDGAEDATLIETKAKGGYVIAPGSPLSCNPAGLPYQFVQNDMSNILVITEEELELLLDKAKTFDERPKSKSTNKSAAPSGGPPGVEKPVAASANLKPWTDFHLRANWDDVLPADWSKVRITDTETDYLRSGSTKDKSATVYHDNGRLTVFTTAAPPFEKDKSYSKIDVYTLLNFADKHGGDRDAAFKAACSAIRKQGYGTQNTGGATGGKQDTGDENQRDVIINMALAAGCELFVNSKKRSFVSVPLENCKANWPISSQDFRRYLHKLHRDKTGTAVGPSVVSDAISTLDAEAAFSKNVHEVYIRIAHHGGNIYIDLGDDKWRAICISATGWAVINDPPVRFVRMPGLLPLPEAVAGGAVAGKLQKLRNLINTPGDKEWTLVLAWILAAYSEGPYPVLGVFGEQGCAKTFLCWVARQIVDPSEAPSVVNPREDRDVIMMANNSHVICVDNLSSIRATLSDLFCSISTGGAHRERKYHTNDGTEVLFKAKCPIAFNGISIALRPDLANRVVIVNLPVIPEDKRRDEAEMHLEFNKAAPEILGGIFDVLVAILAKLPETKLPKKPRMADFALWITAAEAALGWDVGAFMAAYSSNQQESAEQALEADSLGTAICVFMAERAGWSGTWLELLKLAGGGTPQQRWPESGQGVTTKLKRLAPGLRLFGIHWERDRTTDKRGYVFWNTNKSGKPPDPETEEPDVPCQQTIEFDEGEV